MKNRYKIMRGIAILGALFLAIVLFLDFTVNSYNTYKNTLVDQQQEHLLTISKGAGRSLEIYFEEQLTSLALVERSNPYCKQSIQELLDTDKQVFEKQISDYYETWDFVSVCIVNDKGEIRYQQDKTGHNYEHYSFDFSQAIKEKVIGVEKVYQVAPSYLLLSIVQPIMEQGKQVGALIGLLDVGQVFNKLIRDTKVGNKGYVMVKNEEEMIIMHPIRNQVGQGVIEGRRSRYAQLDYTDLERLIERQCAHDEGVAEYYSYWWQDEMPKPVKKISAFSKINVGNEKWIIAAVMDYSEMAGPIQRNLLRVLEMAGIVMIVIATTIIAIYSLEKKRQALLLESRYLKNLNDTLSELQKTEKQMKHYEKLQSIETLTGGIAHEFNNLMTPILGYSQLAIETMEKDNMYYEDMEEIYNAANKAKELVQQIMLFSRRDKIGVNYKVIDLVQEISAGLKMVKAGLITSIHLIEDIPKKEILIYGNATQMQQILINICNNAAQAMAGEDGILKIRIDEVDEREIEQLKSKRLKGREYVRLSISDTGCGMSEKVQSRIFDPFFTTKKVGEGTGVGLSVVKGIVHNHKGDIFVESAEGKGSRFRIYLPICHELRKEDEKKILDTHSTINILVIEDDTRVIKLIKKTFEREGYIITAYTDPIKALDHFKTNPMHYHVVLTDYAMPKITGDKVAEKIKEIRPDIKVIMMTGLIESEVAKYIRSQVIDTFAMKPINYQELDCKIRELINKQA